MTATGTQNFARSYTYDALNRLFTMSDSNTSQACRGLSWAYDAWGNRTAQNVTAGTCWSSAVAVNNKNQLMGSPYQYDAAGNMIADGSHTYTYDAENRLTAVDGGSTATYSYDAVGRRVEKILGTTRTDYVYDLSGNVVSEINNICASICWAAFYLRLNGQLVAEYENGTTYFFHGDHLGSTRLVTGMNQAVVQNLDYLPFGENNSTDSHISTHEFTGDERDAETSLDHTQFRQYTSSLARWMTPDPAGLAAVDPMNPQSWNRYAYVLNDPVDLVDPLGLSSACGDAITCVISSPPPPPDGPSPLLLLSLLPHCSFVASGTFGWLICLPPGKHVRGDDAGTPKDTDGRGNSSGKIVERLNGQNCTPSVLDPSCKPPSCPAVFLNAAEGADLGLPPNAEEAVKAAAGAVVIKRIITRGLVQPLSSSFVRNITALGEFGGSLLAWGPLLIQESFGFYKELKAWHAGTCTTIWTHK
jgi:RHS repeat-associated protein